MENTIYVFVRVSSTDQNADRQLITLGKADVTRRTFIFSFSENHNVLYFGFSKHKRAKRGLIREKGTNKDDAILAPSWKSRFIGCQFRESFLNVITSSMLQSRITQSISSVCVLTCLLARSLES